MAKTPGDVVKFLNDLKKKAIRKSRNEFSVLKKYAKDKLRMNNKTYPTKNNFSV